MSDQERGASWSAPVRCDVRNERETEDSIGTTLRVMWCREPKVAKAEVYSCSKNVKWTGGETIKITRISLRCPLHRSGITAADISQASLDTCVSPSPLSHYNIPSRVLSSLPQSRSREETETAAGHPAGSPETFSLWALRYPDPDTSLSAAFLAPVQQHEDTRPESWCGHECYRSIRY